MAARDVSTQRPRAIRFRVVNTRKQVNPEPGVVLLERDLWDDFGYRCSFRIFVGERRRHRLIGTWKILERAARGPRTTALPRMFEVLDSNFISLGQDLAAYEQVAALPRRLALTILRSLNDIVFLQTRELEAIDGFERAMVRFAEAGEAWRRGLHVLEEAGLAEVAGAEYRTPVELNLQVSAQLKGYSQRHELTLSFRRSTGEHGLRRVTVIVGPNGSGKTQLLAALARGLSGLTSRQIELSPPKPFSRVVAVAYGAFDHFTHPKIRGKGISYVYCGLRVPQRDDHCIILDLEGAMERAAEDVARVARGDRREIWQQALEMVQLGDLVKICRRGAAVILRFMRAWLSAGQKLVALTLTNLVIHLRPGSLVLHDEPETHLHPSLLAALLRAIHFLLEKLDCYAVMATHSLIPLQEVPSTNVVILDRYEDGTVHPHKPVEQSFASTLDEISRNAFRTSPGDENFRTLLTKLRSTFDPEEIRALLGGDLGLGARLQLASLDR
jgi:ABC-type dipeptide/oligopeptide/nickel transport system ATPase component